MVDNISDNQPSESGDENHRHTWLQLDNRARIEVWADRQDDQSIKVRIEVSAPDGEPYKQEDLTVDDGSTVEKALAHGVDRAKRIAGGAFGVPDDDDSSQSTPI